MKLNRSNRMGAFNPHSISINADTVFECDSSSFKYPNMVSQTYCQWVFFSSFSLSVIFGANKHQIGDLKMSNWFRRTQEKQNIKQVPERFAIHFRHFLLGE